VQLDPRSDLVQIWLSCNQIVMARRRSRKKRRRGERKRKMRGKKSREQRRKEAEITLLYVVFSGITALPTSFCIFYAQNWKKNIHEFLILKKGEVT